VFAYRFPILGVLWIVVGLVVAAIYDYFDSLDAAGEILSLIAAILMWPALLFGFEIRIRR
jgi:Mn2+/Fe2+ NRAMP family transporter